MAIACRACRADNPDSAKFCIHCGAGLAASCPSCGNDNPPGANFCANCGDRLGPAEEPLVAADAERRQLTVMFCDLVGSTALSSRLDPEDMRDVLRAYQDACAGVVARYDGFVAKYMGDGVLVYFGSPAAHEDDAERAINTGLGIVEAVKALERDLAVRIGIATGTVVVGDIVGEGASQEAAITGETPNLAARLQEIAEPDAVVIAETTHALAGGLFELIDLGGHDLKGFAEPVRVWSVTGLGGAESRFDATRAENLGQLIGRDEEMEILLRRWRRAKSGEGQVVLISGEPGIGKSRLVRELQERIADESHTPLRHQCSPYHTNSALYPVIERLERTAGFAVGEAAETRLEKLEALIELSGASAPEAGPLLASLMSVPTGDRYAPLEISPQRQKVLTFAALADQLVGLAARRPVLFVLEDAHWIDPTTLELMDDLVARSADAAVLMLITHRPEFDAPWLGRAGVTPFFLGRLDARACVRLVGEVEGASALSEDIRDHIVAQADGVPLFMEELTKSVLEEADSEAGAKVPATIQDSLEARLDRLGPAKEVAQVASVIGRRFDYDLMSRVVSGDRLDLAAGLERLVGSGLMAVRGEPPTATYTFKHALVQDTAYNSLLRNRRIKIHGRIASTLAEDFPEVAATEPELLAHHFTEAGRAGLAIDYWHEAGNRSMQIAAIKEAERHLSRGLDLLTEITDPNERDRRELALQITLGPAMLVSRGWGSPESEQCYIRARDLCQRVGDTRELFPILWGYWMIHAIRSEVDMMHEVERELLAIAGELGDPTLILQAHHAGWGNPFLGNFDAQIRHADKGLAIYDSTVHRSLAPQYGGHDAGVCGLIHKAIALWATGYPDGAVLSFGEAANLAERLSHAPSTAHYLNQILWLHLFKRDWLETVRSAEKSIEFSTELGLPTWLGRSAVVRGYARSALGETRDGLLEIRRGIELAGERGNMGVATFTAFHADALRMSGAIAEALETVDVALRMLSENGEHLWEANAHALKGEILLEASGDLEADAEDCFHQAIGIARAQSAKSWELRAAICLARLWHSQGKTTEARDLLAPVYGWFTEGFDTADLKDAKALLDELE